MEVLEKIKAQIIEALSHAEAEAGLYFSNLQLVHEDEERTAVEGEELEVLDALRELLDEGRITSGETENGMIFLLKS